MSADAKPLLNSDPLDLARDLALDFAADLVIAACDGDMRAAVRALVVAKGLPAEELRHVCASSSKGYVRGRTGC
jgi:hypothetical protein